MTSDENNRAMLVVVHNYGGMGGSHMLGVRQANDSWLMCDMKIYETTELTTEYETVEFITVGVEKICKLLHDISSDTYRRHCKPLSEWDVDDETRAIIHAIDLEGCRIFQCKNVKEEAEDRINEMRTILEPGTVTEDDDGFDNVKYIKSISDEEAASQIAFRMKHHPHGIVQLDVAAGTRGDGRYCDFVAGINIIGRKKLLRFLMAEKAHSKLLDRLLRLIEDDKADVVEKMMQTDEFEGMLSLK